MKHIFITALLFSLLAINVSAQQKAHIHNGDLLFAVANGANAITQSTARHGMPQVDHVAIAYTDGARLCVIDATPQHGVAVRSIDDFTKENTNYIVGEVEGADITASIGNALKYVGLPYDSLFEAHDSAFYCSELVQKSFVDSIGRRIFTTIPMSFHDSTGQVLPFWTDFYQRHGRKVPEGAPGTNPAQIATSRKVTIRTTMR